MVQNEFYELEVVRKCRRRRQVVVSVEVLLSHDGETRNVSAWFWHSLNIIDLKLCFSTLATWYGTSRVEIVEGR